MKILFPALVAACFFRPACAQQDAQHYLTQVAHPGTSRSFYPSQIVRSSRTDVERQAVEFREQQASPFRISFATPRSLAEAMPVNFRTLPAMSLPEEPRIAPPFFKRNLTRAVAVPSLFIAMGALGTKDAVVLERYKIKEERDEHMPDFHTSIDNFLQYGPAAAVYVLDLLKVKGEHDVLNQTVLLVKSELLMAAIVFPIKTITKVPRPDSGALNSFPSGHTATAFVAATFLHKEYGKRHPLYSVLAYTAATGVGALRVMNNRHWITDVVAGAGVGILSTNLVYLTHKNKWGKKKNAPVIMPTYGNKTMAVSMTWALN
ncbi:phosphatase PAP2 family protein [Chryseolinea lacunae]|uniref:Phosphatase PAP2 family protein n=1 Tax=Chryseolinea lacunae TaxID=2801331 RepID=A0ABS1L0N4_9BACT|nr:phosphatase PAP2 family protein [Chryseolinea lacunae]MBL0745259.1 phosphatase PAP2 family protein [Chryseolinea lacunae]